MLEYRNLLVGSCFQLYLNRTPNTNEKQFRVNNIGNSLTREQVILGFIQSAEFQNLAGNTEAGFCSLAFQTVLGRAASDSDDAFWDSRADVYSVLPHGLLESQEYLRGLADSYYFNYVRRFPNTPSDSSLFFDQSAPYAAQDKVNFLSACGNPEAIQITLLTSDEYRKLARTKAYWTITTYIAPPEGV